MDYVKYLLISIMVRKPLLKNDNRTKLFFYDYLRKIMAII